MLAGMSAVERQPEDADLLDDADDGDDGTVHWERAAVHPNNRLNALSGNEWLYFTKTVLRTSYPAHAGHELRRVHGANKPPLLMRHLIEFFTTPGESVLDPFAGVGGTLLGAAMCQRVATGIEVNPEWIDVYRQVCR